MDIDLPSYILLIILVVSMVGVAFINSAEASLVAVNKLRIRYLAEQGNHAAQVVSRLMERHEKFFATIALTVNAFVIFASSAGTALAINLSSSNDIVLLIAPLVMTVFIVALGEITPKTLAAGAAERWSLVVARPIAAIMFLETSIIYLFTLSPRLIRKLMGGKQELWTPSVTEGELRMLIDISKDEGAVAEAEADLLEQVFRFGDQQLHDVMTPRTEIIWVEHDLTLKQFLALYLEHPFTRFPVYKGTMDKVIGILSVKNILRALAQGELQPEDQVSRLVRPAHFVPETKSVSSTLDEMRELAHPMAITVDEFGGIAGLVTRKQLLEAIFGQAGEEEYTTVDENTFLVDAGIGIDEINDELELNLPEGDYHTVAGFVLHQLGRIPEEGAVVEYRNLTLTVKAMDGLKIEKVEVRRSRNGYSEATQ
jgi:putative hemolysin